MFNFATSAWHACRWQNVLLSPACSDDEPSVGEEDGDVAARSLSSETKGGIAQRFGTFLEIRSCSYSIFTNIERLEVKITGNAFPQLSARNADGLQSHAGETSTMSMFKKNVDSTYNLILVSFVYILMQMKPFQCFFLQNHQSCDSLI